MTKTMMVETVVSLRDGHETFLASVRTCCTNCAGDVLAIVGVTPLSKIQFQDPDKMAGAEGLEPTALGFGDRCSTS